jgi:hypothetical protein
LTYLCDGRRELIGRAVDLIADSHPAMVGVLRSGVGHDTPHDLRD